MAKVELGQKVRDVVSRLEGIAVSRIVYLNGCVQYGIKPISDAGKDFDTQYIDESQIDVVSQGIVAKIKKLAKQPGGPSRDAPPSAYRGD